MKTLFDEMGYDFDDEDFETSADMGFTSMYEIENPTTSIRKIKDDFGSSCNIYQPLYLILPFSPKTAQKLPKGKSFSTVGRGITPDDVIKAIIQMADNDAEYKDRIFKLTNGGKPFDLSYDNKGLSEETAEVFSKYANPYAVSEKTQRYKINEDKTITRLAVMPTNELNMIDFDKCDPRLLVRQQAEALLVNEEISQMKEEYKKDPNKTKKNMEDEESKIKRGKSVTSPRITTMFVGFAFPSDSSGIIDKESIDKYNDESVSLRSALVYFSITGKTLEMYNKVIKGSNLSTLNFVEFQRSIPNQSPEVPNIGVAIGSTTITVIPDKGRNKEQFTNFHKRINEEMKSPDFLSADVIKKSVNKFQPIDITTVLECYANGYSSYKRALSNTAFIANNINVLREIKDDLGLKDVTRFIEDDTTKAIDVTSEFIKETESDGDVDLDSEDFATEETTYQASDFID